MSTRENILSKIRAALDSQSSKQTRIQEMNGNEIRRCSPPIPTTPEEQLHLFVEQSEKLQTNIHLVKDQAAARKTLLDLSREHAWKKVATHSSSLVEYACGSLEAPILHTDMAYDAETLATCDAAITGCLALIAQTGSVVVSSRDQGGRVLSILPPHHVVVATREQLLPDWVAGFERLQAAYGENYPSMISFITGPSRTGDIERIVVLGAHGPCKLTLLLIEQAEGSKH